MKGIELHAPSLILGVVTGVIVLAVAWYAGFLSGRSPGGAGSVSQSGVFLAENSIADIASRAQKCVVNIDIKRNEMVEPPINFYFPSLNTGNPVKRQLEGVGSGVIIRASGYILTNNHVVGSADKIKVTLSDKRTFSGTVVGRDAFYDLAIVKIDADGLPVARLGESKNLRPGDFVIAIGSPIGLDHSVTLGIISALDRELTDLHDVKLIQTDAAINQGNSGGPLLDIHGKVIGLNTARHEVAQNIGFAIPVDLIKEVVDPLITRGKISRPYVGIYMQEMDENVARSLGVSTGTKGVVIKGVKPRSPADQAALIEGDIIQRVDGKAIDGSKQVQALVRKHRPGDTVSFLVLRAGRLVPVEVKIGEYPS